MATTTTPHTEIEKAVAVYNAREVRHEFRVTILHGAENDEEWRAVEKSTRRSAGVLARENGWNSRSGVEIVHCPAKVEGAPHRSIFAFTRKKA